MRDCYSLGASNALVFFSEQLAGIAVICFGRLLSTLFAWFLLCYNIISAIFLLLFPLSIQCMKKERARGSTNHWKVLSQSCEKWNAI